MAGYVLNPYSVNPGDVLLEDSYWPPQTLSYIPVVPNVAVYGGETAAGANVTRNNLTADSTPGTRILYVDRLGDSVTDGGTPADHGTLRWCLNQHNTATSGGTTIVFKVSGTIESSGFAAGTLFSDTDSTKNLLINRGKLTIAGQTAPSPGIQIKGMGFNIRASDVLIQHLKVRPGAGPSDAFGLNSTCERVIVDHCSMQYAWDEAAVFFNNVRNCTFVSCLMSDAIGLAGTYRATETVLAVNGQTYNSTDSNATERCGMHRCYVASAGTGMPNFYGTSGIYTNNIFKAWGYPGVSKGATVFYIGKVGSTLEPANGSKLTLANNLYSSGEYSSLAPTGFTVTTFTSNSIVLDWDDIASQNNVTVAQTETPVRILKNLTAPKRNYDLWISGCRYEDPVRGLIPGFAENQATFGENQWQFTDSATTEYAAGSINEAVPLPSGQVMQTASKLWNSIKNTVGCRPREERDYVDQQALDYFNNQAIDFVPSGFTVTSSSDDFVSLDWDDSPTNIGSTKHHLISGSTQTDLLNYWTANYNRSPWPEFASSELRNFRITGSTTSSVNLDWDDITAASTNWAPSIIFNGDFSTGDFTQWKTPSQTDVSFFLVPAYGRPIQYGNQNSSYVGNGDLLSLVAATARTVNGVYYPQGPTRGSSPFAAKMVVKNSVNGVEPNDCDPAGSCTTRRTQLQGELINGQTGLNSMPYGSERWISASFYIPSHWQNVGTGFGTVPGFGLKPQGISPLSGIFGVELTGPGNTWRIIHRYNGVLNSTSWDDLPWWQQMTYDNASPGLPGDPDPDQFGWYDTTDFPDVAASRAALSTVTYDDWTDWIIHVKFDHRTVADGGTGFLDLWKRDGNGAWVQILHIIPKTTTRGGRTFAHGIGYNYPDRSYGSNIGIYCAKNVAWSAPTNLETYVANYKIGDETATFEQMTPDGSSLLDDPIPSSNPNEIMSSGYTRLEEWLHRQSAKVEPISIKRIPAPANFRIIDVGDLTISLDWDDISPGVDITPPTIPTGITATAISSSAIDLTWTESTDTESAVRGYYVRRSVDNQNWTDVSTLVTTTNFQDSNLIANTLYYYQIRAIDNANNLSDWSVSVSSTTQSITPVTNGVILYLDAGNTTSYSGSGTTWNDLSPSGASFSLANGPTFSSPRSISFDGVNDYAISSSSAIQVQDFNVAPNGNRTLEIWFKVTGPVGTRDPALGSFYGYTACLFGDQLFSNGMLRLQDNSEVGTDGAGNSYRAIWTWDDSGTTDAYTNTVMRVGEWNQLVVLLTQYTASYYVNGVLDREFFTSSDIPGGAGNGITFFPNQSTWSLARSNRGSFSSGTVTTNLYLKCDVSIVRQYNRILSPAEIAQNYNAEVGKFPIEPTTPYFSPVKGEFGYGLDWGLTQLSPTINFYKVTNLNTSGTGSFIDAVTGTWSGLRIVIFEISGVLDLSNYSAGPAEFDFQTIRSTNGNLIIAGQTAPTGGFWLKGGRLVLRGEQVLVAHIGIFKTLLSTPSQVESTGDCLNIGNNVNGANKIAIVNCAFYYSQDESLDVYEYATNVTFLNNIMSYSIGREGHHPDWYTEGSLHNFGPLIGGITNTVDRVDFGRNFLSHHYFRNPSIGAENSLVYNNLIYNWGYGGIQFFARDIPARINIENNLSVAGPYTTPNVRPIYAGTNLTGVGTTVYVSGNRLLNSGLSDSIQANLILNNAGSNWSLESTRQGDFPVGVTVNEIGTTTEQKKAFASNLLATVGPRPADRIALIQKPLTECLNSINQTGGGYGTAPTNHPDDVGYPNIVGQTRVLNPPTNPNAAGLYINAAFDFLNQYTDAVMRGVIDTTPPIAPATLTATVNSSSQITLAWSASTDNVAVSGYRLEKSLDNNNWNLLFSSTLLTFTDSGLSSNITYYYRVRAFDAAGNNSDWTSTSARTLSDIKTNSILCLRAGDVNSYNGSGTTWNDLSTANNDGVLVNAPVFFNQGDASYFRFNGTNQGVTTTTQFNSPQVFSILIWFKTSSASGRKIIGFESPQTGTASTAWDRQIYINTSGRVVFGVYDEVADATRLLISPSSYTDGKWHNAVVTFDGNNAAGTNMFLYIDGLLIASGSSVRGAETNNGWWRLAFFQTNGWPGAIAGGGYWTGDIGTAIVYNTILSSATVQTYYNELKNVYIEQVDTEPPTVPSNVFATPNSTSQITVNWSPSVDNVGVASYSMRRSTDQTNWTTVDGITSVSYVQTGLNANTQYFFQVRARDLAGNVSAWSTTASATTNTQTLYNPPYPRLHVNAVGVKTVDASQIEIIARHNIAFFGLWRTWSSNGYDIRTLPTYVKSFNPNIKLLMTNAFVQAENSGTGANQPVYEKMFAENGFGGNGDWWLRNASGQNINGFTTALWRRNISPIVTADYQGRNPGQWHFQWMYASNADGVDRVTSGYGMKEGAWDGIYEDDQYISEQFSPTADYNSDGVNDDPKNPTVQQWIIDGHYSLRNAMKTAKPNWFFAGNMSGYIFDVDAEKYAMPSTMIGINDVGFFETSNNVEFFQGWGAMMRRYRLGLSWLGGDKVGIFGVDFKTFRDNYPTAGYSNARWNRYALCSALMDNGFYQAHDSVDGAYSTILWFDEYWGGSLQQTGYLGYPKEVPQLTARQNGVYIREFDNGLVVVNPGGNGTQTITLPSPGSGYKWQRLSGTQDPTTNNGADQPLSLTIADRDGLILRRAALIDENRVFATNFGDGVYIDGTTSNWFGSGIDHAGDGTVFFRGGDVPGYEFPVILWGGFLDGYNYTAMQVISQTGTSTPYTRCDVNQTDHPHQDHGFYDTNIDLIALPLADRPPTGTASAMKQKFVSQYRAATQTQHQLIVKPGGNNMAEQSNGFLYQRFYRKWEQDCFTNLSVNENYAMMLCQTKTAQFNMTFTDADGILRGPGTSDWRIVASFNPRFANPTTQNSSKIFFRAQVADSSFDFAGNYNLWKQDVSVPIFPDTWHYIEFAYRFSPNSDGFVWMAIDGVTVFSRSGATLPTWTGSGSAPKQNRVFMVPAYQTNEAAPRPLTTWITDYEMFTDWPVDATTPHPT